MKITELYTKTMRCINPDCMGRIRVGRALYVPAAAVGALGYCPLCGHPANAEPDDNENYMETLAEAFDIQVEVLQAIMNIWDRAKYPRLSQFIDVLKEEAANNIELEEKVS